MRKHFCPRQVKQNEGTPFLSQPHRKSCKLKILYFPKIKRFFMGLGKNQAPFLHQPHFSVSRSANAIWSLRFLYKSRKWVCLYVCLQKRKLLPWWWFGALFWMLWRRIQLAGVFNRYFYISYIIDEFLCKCFIIYF